MTKEGFTQIVNFMTPWAGVLVLGRDHTSYIVKMHYFFQKLPLFSTLGIEQTKYVQSYDDQGRPSKIVNFITPGGGIFC